MALIITCLGLFLEVVLLSRAYLRGRLREFPFFFSYVAFVLVQSALRLVVRLAFPESYSAVFWATEFIGVFAGCAIVFEFYKVGLRQFAGVAKLARNALLLVFSLTVGKVIVTALPGLHEWTGAIIIQLERDLRFVQIAAVVTLLGLFMLYRIPTSRAIKGLALGYGAYLGISMLNLTYLDYFRSDVMIVARYVQSSAYLLALAVWGVALWSRGPEPVVSESGVPRYSVLQGETAEKLASSQLAVRSALDS
ncbi:MAG TPA: hypothetical protein VMT51_15085 [Dongiaceae bacterium]|nr:hypothetical protein [Dongiaceae bacterium]